MTDERTNRRSERVRRPRRGMLGATAATLCLALVVGACGTGSNNAGDGVIPGSIPNELEADEAPQYGGKLVVAVPAETNGWNPSINQWADAGSMVGSSVMEPLVILDKEGNPEMYLAESITPVDGTDFKEWTVTVKPGIEFHNGEKLDANAVQLNLEATFTTGLTQIAMAPMYDRVEPAGPLSVHVFLKQTWAQYPQALASAGWMLAPAMLSHENANGEVDGGVLDPIGTGPFVFQQWKQNDTFRVTKFDKYWRKAANGDTLPYLDEIVFRPVVDDDAKERALGNNDIDMAYTTSAQVAERMSENDDFTVIRDYTSERTFVMLNTQDGELNAGNPFTDEHARKAVAYATNRQQIADLVGTGVQITTQGYRPDSQWHVDDADAGYYPYDPAKAKEEIEAYKAATGADSLSFKLSGLPALEDATLMQALQQQWREVGIDAQIEQIDQVKYISTIALGGFQAAWFRWYGYPDPDANYVYNAEETAQGGVHINFTQYTSPEMQANLLKGRSTNDFAERKAANDAVIKEVNENALNIWLFDTPYAIIANNQVRGLNEFRTRPFGNYLPKPYWSDVWIKPAT